MSDNEIRKVLIERLTVPLEVAAQVLDIGLDAARGAVKRGEIPTTGIGRSHKVPCYWLREKVGLDQQAA